MRKPKYPSHSISPSIFTVKPKALNREISTNAQKNFADDTIIYGEDDALPLRIAKAVDESPAATSCIETISQFIKGSGFSNKELEKIKIDEQGTTLWDLHCTLSDSLALFSGFSVNLKYNDELKITNAYPMSFESVRFKKPVDNSPIIQEIKHNPYYGTVEWRKEYTKCYPVFDLEKVKKQASQMGAEFYGQCYYYGKTSPLYRFYPVPKYWSAEEAILADHKLQEFHNEELENGFFQSVLINAIGNPSEWSKNPRLQKTVTGEDGVKRKESTKTVGEEFGDQMSESFSGSKKAGTAMVMWSLNTDQAVKVQAFPSGINGDRIISTQDSITKTITIATRVPSILANISEGVSLGSGGSEMQKAVELMQSRTQEQRKVLENFYNDVLIPNLFNSMPVRVEIKSFNPITVPVTVDPQFWEVLTPEEKREFVKLNLPNVKFQTAQVSAPIVDPLTGEVTQPVPVNDALKNITLQQLGRIQSIVKKFNRAQIDPNDPKGLTYQQAEQMLLSYGLTADQISAWLVTNDEE